MNLFGLRYGCFEVTWNNLFGFEILLIGCIIKVTIFVNGDFSKENCSLQKSNILLHS